MTSDQHRLEHRAGRTGDPRHRIRRRDEERRVHHHELPDAGPGRAVACTAPPTEGADGDTSILFGLSGTGKTTLSADPKRRLIGDDEHCWSDDGIFNIEGGCYAKVIDLSEQAEPDIYRRCASARCWRTWSTIRTHARSITPTRRSPPTRAAPTRSSSSTTHQDALRGRPSQEHHLPDLRRLRRAAAGQPADAEQAMYHFISGYTAKVAGTEVGVTEPEATFSPASAGRSSSGTRPSTPSCWPTTSAGTVRRLAGQHRLVRRRLRHRQAHEIHDGRWSRRRREPTPSSAFRFRRAAVSCRRSCSRRATRGRTRTRMTKWPTGWRIYSEKTSKSLKPAATPQSAQRGLFPLHRCESRKLEAAA
jgi:hypothetical protein